MRVRDVGWFVLGAGVGSLALMMLWERPAEGAPLTAPAPADRPARPSPSAMPAERAAALAAPEAQEDPPAAAPALPASAGAPAPLPDGLSVVFVDGEPMLCDVACAEAHVGPVIERLLAGEVTRDERRELQGLSRAMAARLAGDSDLRARFLAALPEMMNDRARNGLAMSVLRDADGMRAEAAAALFASPDPEARRRAAQLVTMRGMGRSGASDAERRLLTRSLSREQDETVLLATLGAASNLREPLPGAADRAVTLAIYGSTPEVRAAATMHAVRLDPDAPGVQRLARARLREGTQQERVQVLMGALLRGGPPSAFYLAEARRLVGDPATDADLARNVRRIIERAERRAAQRAG